MRPLLIDETEVYQTVHDYKNKTRQFLENSGKHIIVEKNGFVIRKATISGLLFSKDITNTILLLSGQIKCGPNDCPIFEFEIDTCLFLEYANTDIEVGVTKILEIEYMTDDIIAQEKKVRRTEHEDETFSRFYDPTLCIDGAPSGDPKFSMVAESGVYLINKDRNPNQ